MQKEQRAKPQEPVTWTKKAIRELNNPTYPPKKDLPKFCMDMSIQILSVNKDELEPPKTA